MAEANTFNSIFRSTGLWGIPFYSLVPKGLSLNGVGQNR